MLKWLFILSFIALITYFYRKFLKKRKFNDTHVEVMDSGTKKERLTYVSLSTLYLISFLILTISLTYLTYQTRISTFDLAEIIYANFEWSKITLLPWLFISIFILALPYELLLFRFIPDKVPKKQRSWHLRKTYIAIFITLILMSPFVFLLFDFYTIIAPEKK